MTLMTPLFKHITPKGTILVSGYAPADTRHDSHLCHGLPHISYNGTTSKKYDTIDYPINYSCFSVTQKNNRYWATVYIKGTARDSPVSCPNFVEIYLGWILEYEGSFDATSPEEDALVAIADTIIELNTRKIKDIELLIRDKINDTISTERRDLHSASKRRNLD